MRETKSNLERVFFKHILNVKHPKRRQSPFFNHTFNLFIKAYINTTGSRRRTLTIVEGHFWGSKWKAKSPATRATKVWQTSGKAIRPKQQKWWITGSWNKQMSLEEVNGLKEAWKERNSIPIGSIWCRKVRMDNCRLKSNANKESKGLMASPWTPRMRMK